MGSPTARPVLDGHRPTAPLDRDGADRPLRLHALPAAYAAVLRAVCGGHYATPLTVEDMREPESHASAEGSSRNGQVVGSEAVIAQR